MLVGSRGKVLILAFFCNCWWFGNSLRNDLITFVLMRHCGDDGLIVWYYGNMTVILWQSFFILDCNIHDIRRSFRSCLQQNSTGKWVNQI